MASSSTSMVEPSVFFALLRFKSYLGIAVVWHLHIVSSSHELFPAPLILHLSSAVESTAHSVLYLQMVPSFVSLRILARILVISYFHNICNVSYSLSQFA